jgi:DNA-binding response OmpR family regulator
MRILWDNEGAIVSRSDLIDRCWREGEASDEALTQAVAQIRRTLTDLCNPAIGRNPVETRLSLEGHPRRSKAVAVRLAESAEKI